MHGQDIFLLFILAVCMTIGGIFWGVIGLLAGFWLPIVLFFLYVVIMVLVNS